MAADTYDLGVLGGGPGGVAAATRAAQRGARVCLIESGDLGGACLNRGCIPARALGTTAWLAAMVRRSRSLGIRIERSEIAWADAIARKDRIVRRLREGLRQLIQARAIQLIPGRAVVGKSGRIVVTPLDGGGPSEVSARAVVVATGSRPKALPTIPFNGRTIVSSDDMLQATTLPKRLVIIGGGVVGCELASYLAPVGVEVTLMEQAQQLLPGQDPEVAQTLASVLAKAGVTVLVGTAAAAVTAGDQGVVVRGPGGRDITADQALITVGRQPNTRDIGLEQVGAALTEAGHVTVDDRLQTSVPGLYAVGDILGRYQTAYTATHEGAVAAENALGTRRPIDYSAVPDCVFTLPEIATVGLTESQAKAEGMAVAVSRVPWSACGRAATLEETDGFLKVVYDTRSQRILGVQMIGPRATDLIAEATLAIRQQMTLTALTEVLHGHPTLAEALWEASAQPLMRALYVR